LMVRACMLMQSLAGFPAAVAKAAVAGAMLEGNGF
jgi:hypothetical protein